MKKIYGEFFDVLLRKRNDDLIFDDPKCIKQFTKIKPRFGYWMADPFLIEINNTDYLYVEMCSYFTGNGYIARAKIDSKKIKWETVIKDKTHYSFPNVFEENGMVFIVPENSQTLSVFKLITNNGLKPIVRNVLLSNVKAVDSVMCRYNNKVFLLSYILEKPFNKLNIYILKDDVTTLINSISDESKTLRPAGKIFVYKDKMIFPTQDNKNGYGDNIIFNVVDLESKMVIKEKMVIDVRKFLEKKYNGCHTYNFSKNYEVIDVRKDKLSLLRILGKVYRILFNPRKERPYQ